MTSGIRLDESEYDYYTLRSCMKILNMDLQEWLNNDMEVFDVVEAAMRKLCDVEAGR